MRPNVEPTMQWAKSTSSWRNDGPRSSQSNICGITVFLCEYNFASSFPERRVVVRVRGGERSARRNLLAIIRYDLERIHSEFKDRLDAQAKVPLAEFPAFSVDYKKLFVSYSHKDEALRDELETHLKLLQRQQVISIWHDRKILPGDEWDRGIDSRIDRANIILLLISADFIASEYCWQKEVTRALQRHAAKEATVVPLLLRPCDWKGAPFGKLQGLPKDMKAVTAWPDRDAAWTDVAIGIRAIAERVRSTGFLGGSRIS